MATTITREDFSRSVLWAIAPVAAAAMLISISHPATADSSQGANTRQPSQLAAPIKDCTRTNNRYGYYGNQWCTEAEQARWDRWMARDKFASDKR